MENPLIINIRCTCIEEYIRIQELHQEYKRQKKEGDILSIFVGSDEVIKGKYEIVDKLIEKKDKRRPSMKEAQTAEIKITPDFVPEPIPALEPLAKEEDYAARCEPRPYFGD